MTENPSNPPTTTFADLPAGRAYRATGAQAGQAWQKSTAPNTAMRLTDGVLATNVDPAEVVIPAPAATFTLFPPAT